MFQMCRGAFIHFTFLKQYIANEAKLTYRSVIILTSHTGPFEANQILFSILKVGLHWLFIGILF